MKQVKINQKAASILVKATVMEQNFTCIFFSDTIVCMMLKIARKINAGAGRKKFPV